MTVIDILTRVDVICQKYDKYDAEKLNGANVAGEDPFARLYGSVDAEISYLLLQKAEAARQEKNRATVVALNTEIRRTKASSSRRTCPSCSASRSRSTERITKIKLVVLYKCSSSCCECILILRLTLFYGNFDDEYFKGTEESNKFCQEYEMRRMKQDEGLDVIGEGLATLKNMSSDMNEELDRQVPLMDEMDDKVDRANADLKNTNVRLKQTILQVKVHSSPCIILISPPTFTSK
ncbi:hypothetical protein CFC21_011625 [Triticum aestivum]|uniref:t-SNARE coiled-coil homology domain-containing protein n=3 Tax=Triticinae TaxID=1648030 RepID=A0A9R1DNP7_WHEAT|nr:hypothetical protein CFC21_011625 [Triticum aestivum]